MSVTQLCPTLCNPVDHSPPGFSVHGFSWQEHWSRLPCSPAGHLPDPGIEHGIINPGKNTTPKEYITNR